MLRIEYGEVVGREPLGHRVVLHVDVAAVAQRLIAEVSAGGDLHAQQRHGNADGRLFLFDAIL